LYGVHEADVIMRLRESLGQTRALAWGRPDLSANPFRAIWEQLSGLYRNEPQIEGTGDVVALSSALRRASWLSALSGNQRDTLGLRNMIVAVEVDNDRHNIRFRPIYPDLASVQVNPDTGAVLSVKEWRDAASTRFSMRATGWVSVEHSLGLRVWQDERGEILDQEIVTDASGLPCFPVASYHAAHTANYWDPWTGIEIVEGSLNLGVLYTEFMHSMANASWAQRYLIGAQPAGAAQVEGRAQVVADPATVALFEQSIDSSGQPSAGQWNAPFSPRELIEAISMYEQRLLGMALGTAEVARSTSDIRSGYSLAVSREARREAQNAFIPTFLSSDIDLLNIVAAQLGIPVHVYNIKYSLQSDAENRAEILDFFQRGLLTVEEARMALRLE